MTSRELLTTVIAPELAGESTERLDAFLELAAARMNATEWGTVYQQAAVYLAAHLITVSNRNAGGEGGVGAVQQVRNGDLSITFGAAMGVLDKDAILGTTSYGLQYLALRRQRPIVGMVV